MGTDEYEWEQLIRETGGASCTFKEAKGAVVTVQNHVEVASFFSTLLSRR